MDKQYGVLLVSHVYDAAYGITKLMDEVASDVSITFSGGTEDKGVGTNLELILKAIEANECDDLLVFYDLGSSKINLEIAEEMTDKNLNIYDVAFLEGSYTAAALLQAGVALEEIERQLSEIVIK